MSEERATYPALLTHRDLWVAWRSWFGTLDLETSPWGEPPDPALWVEAWHTYVWLEGDYPSSLTLRGVEYYRACLGYDCLIVVGPPKQDAYYVLHRPAAWSDEDGGGISRDAYRDVRAVFAHDRRCECLWLADVDGSGDARYVERGIRLSNDCATHREHEKDPELSMPRLDAAYAAAARQVPALASVQVEAAAVVRAAWGPSASAAPLTDADERRPSLQADDDTHRAYDLTEVHAGLATIARWSSDPRARAEARRLAALLHPGGAGA